MAFYGKVALVTGGASGMGRVSALRLANEGAQVAIFDLNEEALAQVAAESDNIHSFACDISDFEQVKNKVAEVEEKLGAIDRVTHCAAIMPGWSVLDTAPDKHRKIFDVNYMGTVHIINTVVPRMVERNSGDVIIYGSVAGYAPVPYMGSYSASKGAINIITESMIHELKDTNLRISLVCPPGVNTPLVAQLEASEGPKTVIKGQTDDTLAQPDDVVDAVEKGLEKGKKVIFPREALLLRLWHALFPRLWWKVLLKQEAS